MTGRGTAAPRGGLAMFEAWDRAATGAMRWIASAGAAGMIAVASLTVADALLRSTVNAPIHGLNEIVSMVFAVAVAACLPFALAAGAHLTVDLLERRIGPRRMAGLEAAGALLTLAFHVAVAAQLAAYARELQGQNRLTAILGWPQAPFMYAAAALFAIASFAQVFVSMRALRKIDNRTSLTTLVVGAALLAGLALVAYEPAARTAAKASPIAVVLAAFLALWALLLAKLPMGPVMGFVGVVGASLFLGTSPALSTIGSNIAGFLTNSEVAALPLFLLMGSLAIAAGIAEDIYRMAHAALSGMRGGLALATIGGCAGFGAVTGSSIATVATIGKVSLPEMRARGYSDRLSLGCVCAGGTLGQLVPPSTAAIVYALLTEQSIGKLFVGLIVPAMITVASYFIVIFLIVRFNAAAAPAANRTGWAERRAAFDRGIGALTLFVAVFGGLYFGVFTTTESAAVGVVGTFIYAVVRGRLTIDTLGRVLSEATASVGMIYILIFGAFTFSFFMAASGLPERMSIWAGTLQLPAPVLVCIILAFYLVLGCVMDSFGLMIITTPIIAPLIAYLGYDLVWWGIVMIIVVETGMITPPFGLNIFMLKSITDRPLGDIYSGVVPFVVADIAKLALLVAVPSISLWLPSTMFK